MDLFFLLKKMKIYVVFGADYVYFLKIIYNEIMYNEWMEIWNFYISIGTWKYCLFFFAYFMYYLWVTRIFY